MTMESPAGEPGQESAASRAAAKRMRQVLGQFVLLVAIMAITSGRITWTWMWVYVGAGIVILAVNASVLSRELIAERGQPGENVKSWDRRLTSLAIIPSLAIPAVAGLQERFAWLPQVSLSLHLCGLAFMIVGQLLFTWAMASNKYFSTAVRIQIDRGHTVAAGGPYRFVRHPGYVGHIVSSAATALLLGSVWALVPAAVLAVLLVIRTAFEDRTLLLELEGYQQYAYEVRYRLVPVIW